MMINCFKVNVVLHNYIWKIYIKAVRSKHYNFSKFEIYKHNITYHGNYKQFLNTHGDLLPMFVHNLDH